MEDDEEDFGETGTLSRATLGGAAPGNARYFEERQRERERSLAAAYRDVAETLKARRGTSAAERWFSIAQAALSPAENKWHALGNISGALAGIAGENRTEDLDRAKALSELNLAQETQMSKSGQAADALMLKYMTQQNKPTWVRAQNPDGTVTLVPIFQGAAPAGTSIAEPQGLPEPKSRAEFDALPSGAQFKAPDGTIRSKP